MGVKKEVKMVVMRNAQDKRLLMNTPFGNVQHAVLNSLERQLVNSLERQLVNSHERKLINSQHKVLNSHL